MRVDSVLTVREEELAKPQWRTLLTSLTFIDNDEIEVSAYDHQSGLGQVRLPRGAWYLLPKGLDVTDLRSRPTLPKVRYARKLDAPGYEGQVEAMLTMYKREQGQIIAPPGNGKTEIGLAFAASCKTRTLVIVHTNDLFRQWIERAEVSVPNMSLGKIQGKTCQIGHLTIATAQSLRKYLYTGSKFWRQFGCLLIDETHHAAAETWEWILNVCPAYYRFGLSASTKRSDGRQKLVGFNVGPIIYKLEFKSQVPIIVRPVGSQFRSTYNGTQYQQIITKLVRDEERNILIAKIAEREIAKGRTVLVLSRQIKHLENIYAAMSDPETAQIVTGKLTSRQRAKFNSAFRSGSLRCVLGTQIYEEGVDIPRIDRIILAYPGTEITALQKVGRGARRAEGKTETIVYDIVDEFVRVLARQYLRRRKWYQSVNIKVERAVKHGNKDKGKGNGSQGQAGRLIRDFFKGKSQAGA